MTISKEPIRCKLANDNEPIEQIMNFEYVDTNISSYGNLEDEVRSVANKAAFSVHLKPIEKNLKMGINCKFRRQVTTYAVETRAESVVIKRLFRLSVMRTARMITDFTLLDRKTSKDRWRQSHINDAVRWIRAWR